MFYYLNKTIKYGLYLLVFLLPVQTRWLIKSAGSEYLTVSLYGTDILLLIIIALFIILKLQITNYKLQITNKFKIQNSKFLFFSIAGLGLITLISIFFAADKLIAIYHFVVFLAGIGLFWLIVRANYDKLKLIYAFLAGIFFQACLGIWQFLTQSSFSNKWLGMAAHSAGDLGVSVVETLRGGRWLRAYGGLDHPNVLGGLLTIGTLLMINLMIKNRKSGISYSKFSIFQPKADPPQADNFQFSNNFQFFSPRLIRLGRTIFKQYLLFISYFLLLVFITALFFTFSRGAWAGLIIGVLAILAMMIIKKDLQGQKVLLKIIFSASVLIFILFSQYQDLVLTRLSQDTRLEVKSNVERVESLQQSWGMIKDNWLLGVGIGNYTIKLKTQNSKLKTDNSVWCYQPVHNVFLLVWAELGIFGLLFFISLLLSVMFCGRDAKPEGQSSPSASAANIEKRVRAAPLSHPVRVTSYPLLAALIAMFLADHWWWSLHFGVLLFWLILGLIFAVDSGNNKTYNENII